MKRIAAKITQPVSLLQTECPHPRLQVEKMSNIKHLTICCEVQWSSGPLSTCPQNQICEINLTGNMSSFQIHPRQISEIILDFDYCKDPRLFLNFLFEAFLNNCNILTVSKCTSVVLNCHFGSCIMAYKSVSCIPPNTKFL